MSQNRLKLAFSSILLMGFLISCGHAGTKENDPENNQKHEQEEQRLELTDISFNNKVQDPIRGTTTTGIIVSSSHKISLDQIQSKITVTCKGTDLAFSVREIGDKIYILVPAVDIYPKDIVTLSVSKSLSADNGLSLRRGFWLTFSWPEEGKIEKHPSSQL